MNSDTQPLFPKAETKNGVNFKATFGSAVALTGLFATGFLAVNEELRNQVTSTATRFLTGYGSKGRLIYAVDRDEECKNGLDCSPGLCCHVEYHECWSIEEDIDDADALCMQGYAYEDSDGSIYEDDSYYKYDSMYKTADQSAAGEDADTGYGSQGRLIYAVSRDEECKNGLDCSPGLCCHAEYHECWSIEEDIDDADALCMQGYAYEDSDGSIYEDDSYYKLDSMYKTADESADESD